MSNAIKQINLESAQYPGLLGKIHNPPPYLYWRGQLPPPETQYLAVVGTRLPSPYGQAMTWEITKELAQAGLVIVSGLAFGIDGLAHEAALEAQGITVAVLGSGLDETCLYPSIHRGLAQKIIKNNGAIISEYPPLTPPLKMHFPARNRIIAGLSLGTVVIEARKGSGSLITARFALEEGREVFAVPGPITSPNSFGPHWLLKHGACLVQSAHDILDALSIKPVKKKPPILTTEETLIWQNLGAEVLPLDALARRTKLDIATLSATLSLMEIKGLVREIDALHFLRL